MKDDTYAIFRVIRSDGTEIPLLDSGSESGTNTYFSNFIIQSLQEARMEKHQIIETFGETFIFFFGEQPRFIDVTAILLNSNDFNWKAEFLANYDTYLRGTKLTELGACAYLFYDDNIVSGYLLSCAVAEQADQPMLVQLQFRMILVNYNNISFVGDPNFPIRASVQLPPDVAVGDLTTSIDSGQFNKLVEQGIGISGEVIDGQFVASAFLERSIPLRGTIAANVDEWTGEPSLSRADFDETPFVSSTVEVADINRAIATALLPVGADFGCVGSPDFMLSAGIGPTFSASAGVGVGFGSPGGSGATFGASASFSVGFSAGVSVGADANAASAVGPGVSTSPTAQSNALIAAAQAAAEASTESITGKSSGGAGLSAGFSVGVSFGAGVSSGIGPGDSYAGSSGVGAAISVGGSPSAFTLVACNGDVIISEEAQAQISASAFAGFSIGIGTDEDTTSGATATASASFSLGFG